MFIDLVRSRRSIRQYEDRPVEPEKIELMLEAVLRSPSSRGFTPWSFIVVTDPDILMALSKAKPHGASFLAKAPLAIVVCADPGTSDVWVEDASIAALYLHLAATDLGLGSCWIQLRERMYNEKETARNHVARLLELPDGIEVEAIIAIGHPKEEKAPHPQSSLAYDKVSWQRYGQKR